MALVPWGVCGSPVPWEVGLIQALLVPHRRQLKLTLFFHPLFLSKTPCRSGDALAAGGQWLGVSL